MAVETDIDFVSRGVMTRNGAIRSKHPDTYTRLANGLYVKYRRRIGGFLYYDGDSFTPTGASWTQTNSSAGPDLSEFNNVAFLSDLALSAREDGSNNYRLILHVFGQDCQFRATLEQENVVLTVTCSTSRNWYKAEVSDGLTGVLPRFDNVYYECIDNGTTPEVRGWLLEEAIMAVADAP
jgi:hypothetical protein